MDLLYSTMDSTGLGLDEVSKMVDSCIQDIAQETGYAVRDIVDTLAHEEFPRTPEQIVKANLRYTSTYFDNANLTSVPWTEEQLSDKNPIKYVGSPGTFRAVKMGCHNGQRKLLMSEIQFYQMYNSDPTQDLLVIYAGSAPGNHTPVILKMFPNIKLILIDPAYHVMNNTYTYIYRNDAAVTKKSTNQVRSLTSKGRYTRERTNLIQARFIWDTRRKVDVLRDRTQNAGLAQFQAEYKTLVSRIQETKSSRVFVIQDYMSVSLASKLAEALNESPMPFLFVSDIRTATKKSHPVDLDYLWNDALQLRVMKTLNPIVSMIKFHPPYFDPTDHSVLESWTEPMYKDDIQSVIESFGIDLIENYRQGKYIYVSSEKICLQAWAPVSSTETRLIVPRDHLSRTREYDHYVWDDKFAYFKMMRGYAHYSLYESLKAHDPKCWYDGCFDCNLEILILASVATGLSMTDDHDLADLLINIPGVRDKILGYTALIDQPYGLRVKCSHHGTLTKIPNHLYFYLVRKPGDNMSVDRFEVNPNETFQVKQVIHEGRLVCNVQDVRLARNLSPMFDTSSDIVSWFKESVFNH